MKKTLKTALSMSALALMGCMILSLAFVSCGDDPKSSEKNILEFSFEEMEIAEEKVTILADKVFIEVPKDTDLIGLVPVIEISKKAKISPESGEARDFSEDVKYVVTAEDKSTREYTVVVTPEAKSSAANILTFSIDDVEGVINEDTSAGSDKRIDIALPAGTDLTKVSPVITVSPFAAVTPDSEVEVNLSSSFTYQVTAEDGTTKNYTVYATIVADLSISVGFIDGEKTIVMYDIDGNLIDLSKVYQIPLYADEDETETTKLILTYGNYEEFSDVKFIINGDDKTDAFSGGENIFEIDADDYVYDKIQLVDIYFEIDGNPYVSTWKFKVVDVVTEEDDEEEDE